MNKISTLVVISLYAIGAPASGQNRSRPEAVVHEERLLQRTVVPALCAVAGAQPIMSPNFRTSLRPSTSPRAGAIFFQSGFEEGWTFGAPPGWRGTTPNSDSSWHRNDYTTGWSSAAGFVSAYVWSFAGGFSARFHTAGLPAGRHGFMTTPEIDLSVATDSVFLSFWWTNSGSGATMLDSLKIFLSTDGGSTFPLYVGYVGPTGNPWIRAIAYLPSRSRQTMIKFQANGDGTSTDILLDEVIVFQKGAAFSGTLTIPGTFSSFTDAARQLTLFGVSGPTQINVQAGTYADSITFPPISGAGPGSPIIFRSSGGPVTVQRGGVLTANISVLGATTERTDDATISLWGTDYMTFNGIGISDKPGTVENEWGYHVRAFVPTDGATNNTITNSTIVMNKLNTNTAGIEQQTFWALTSQSGSNSRNQYSNSIVRSCAVRGIALVGYPPYLDEDNEIGSLAGGTMLIADIGGPGLSPSAVQISAQNGVRVHGVNIQSMSVVSTSLPAIFIGGSTTFADSVINFQVYNNTIHGILNTGTDVNGIISAIRVGFSSTLPTTAFRGRIYNNIVYDLLATGTRPDGSVIAFYHHATTGSVVEWYNNTVYLDNRLIGSGGVNTLFRINTGTAILRNNILVHRSALVAAGINYGYYRVGGTLVSSNNAVHVDTTLSNQFVGRDGVDYRTLHSWQSSSPGRDTLSVFHDPHFVNSVSSPYNLHIDTMFSTPLESGGVILPAVSSDIDGQARYPNAGYPENPLFPPTAPDVGADEFAGLPLDVVPPTITYNPLTNTTSTSNRTLANVILADVSGINISPGLKPRVYFKKSSHANTFVDNTSTSNGWKYTETPGSSSPFVFILNYSLLYPNGVAIAGDTIQYFVVAQDLSAPPNVAINSGTLNLPPLSVALTAAAFPITGAINSYVIATTTLSGAYSVGAGQPYSTLTGNGGFFAAINGGVLTANVTATIVSDIFEPGTHSLREWGEIGGSGFTVTIRPTGSIRTLRGNSNGPLTDLDGADRLTIDGNLGGVKSLRIRNDNTGASASTIMFRRDAIHNSITSCIIEGASGDSSGTIVFGPGTFGNSSNTIVNTEIRDRSDSIGVPSNAILSVSPRNRSNTIQNNTIFNWSRSAVRLRASGAGNGWGIISNSIYQTSARTTEMQPIVIEAGSGHTVAGNTIGGSAPDRSGGPLIASLAASNSTAFTGIHIAVGDDSVTVVSSNTFANIRCTNIVGSAFEGIRIASGRANVTGNIIGGGANPWDTVSTISDVPGAIQCSGGSTVLLSNNVISNVRTRDSLLFGISVTGSASCTVAENTIHDLQSNSTVAPLRGISLVAAGSLVERNTLYNLSNASIGTSPSIVIAGIHVGSVASTTLISHVRRNRIYGLSVSGTGLGSNAPQVLGVYVEGQSIVHCYNNMVALGHGVAGDLRLNGLEDAGSARNTWYYNSVLVGGQHPVVGTNRTSAFTRTGTAPDTLRNNILCNLRIRGMGGHFAISNGNSGNWNAGTSNYNLLYTSSPDSVARWLTTGYSLAAWRGVSGGDENTVFGDPRFISAIDLHCRTDTLSPANNAAISIASITSDFDGDFRSPLTPDIGADEFGPQVSVQEKDQIVPVSFGLEQNHPNPFNPSTIIRFQMPAASAGGQNRYRVTIKVFDVLGRQVASLVDEELEAGIYERVFNAGGLASGVYFYRFSAGTFTETKRGLLVR